MEISGIILAGGKSLRLGHDKVEAKLGRTTLLQQVVSRLDPLTRDIIIVTAEERTFAPLAGRSRIRLTSDIIPGQGSLGGIYTGLVRSDTLYNLVVAADMPFLSKPLLKYMIEVSDGFDFVLPRVNNRYEPLHAVYSRDCIAPIEALIRRGRKVITDLIDHVKVRFVEAGEVERYDPDHLSFFNINTREDLERARRIAGGAGD